MYREGSVDAGPRDPSHEQPPHFNAALSSSTVLIPTGVMDSEAGEVTRASPRTRQQLAMSDNDDNEERCRTPTGAADCPPMQFFTSHSSFTSSAMISYERLSSF